MMKNRQDINWDLAARVYSGEASQKEVTSFENWLENPENKKEWNKISEDLGKVDHALVSEKVDIDMAWNRVKSRTIQNNKGLTKVFRFGIFAAAASIIIAIAIFLNPQNTPTIESNTILAQSENTLQQIDLNDGSKIDLNRNSSIEYPKSFTSDSRSISLKGEAFFDVAADKSRPFVISTNRIQIKVVGTSFNVKALPNAKLNEVSVSSGIVEVSSLSNLNNKIILKAGDKAIFNAEDNSLVKMQLSTKNYMAWKTKEFAFKNEKLSDAITLIEEVYSVKIQIPDSFKVETKKISTTFDKYTVEHIMVVLDGIYGVDFKYENN